MTNIVNLFPDECPRCGLPDNVHSPLCRYSDGRQTDLSDSTVAEMEGFLATYNLALIGKSGFRYVKGDASKESKITFPCITAI